jgi:SM-20-related protein
MLDLLTLPRFIDAAPILQSLRNSSTAAATIYGGRAAVESNVRRTKRIAAGEDVRNLVVQRLSEAKEAIAAHFGVQVDVVEEPQFLRYDEGDFFVAHQDGNIGLTRDDSRFRRISTVIFLSEPQSYEGGALVFHPDFKTRHAVTPDAGTLVAFRAETTHEVVPLTRGERFTIASWYRVAE